MIAGSELVPVMSSPPATLPRKVCVPPSKGTNSTSILRSLKNPISLAIYGGRWTTLGGVTGTPKTTLRLVCASAVFKQKVREDAAASNHSIFFMKTSFVLRSIFFDGIAPGRDSLFDPFRQGHQSYS